MKHLITAVCLTCILSACALPQRAPSTELTWSCYKRMHKYHKDTKPGDFCGLCSPHYRIGGECIPGTNVSDGSRMYPSNAHGMTPVRP
jgi:hypothetical protein